MTTLQSSAENRQLEDGNVYFKRALCYIHGLDSGLPGNAVAECGARLPFRLLAQAGQPLPRIRFPSTADHSFPQTEQCHQTFVLLFGRAGGIGESFFKGCHSAASAGKRVEKSLKSIKSFRFAQ